RHRRQIYSLLPLAAWVPPRVLEPAHATIPIARRQGFPIPYPLRARESFIVYSWLPLALGSIDMVAPQGSPFRPENFHALVPGPAPPRPHPPPPPPPGPRPPPP